MWTIKLLGTVILALLLVTPCWAADAGTEPSETKSDQMEAMPGESEMDHSKMDHSTLEAAGKKEASGIGVIESVDVESKSITITHDPLPEFGWPKMTMDLTATKKVDLSQIKAGDKVTFTVKLGMDKKFRVIDVKPVQ